MDDIVDHIQDDEAFYMAALGGSAIVTASWRIIESYWTLRLYLMDKINCNITHMYLFYLFEKS